MAHRYCNFWYKPGIFANENLENRLCPQEAYSQFSLSEWGEETPTLLFYLKIIKVTESLIKQLSYLCLRLTRRSLRSSGLLVGTSSLNTGINWLLKTINRISLGKGSLKTCRPDCFSLFNLQAIINLFKVFHSIAEQKPVADFLKGFILLQKTVADFKIKYLTVWVMKFIFKANEE